MSETPADWRKRLFIIETDRAPDALLRVLSICAARQVALSRLDFAVGAEGGAVRFETAAMSEAEADRLSAALQAVTLVRGVSLGWRAGAG